MYDLRRARARCAKYRARRAGRGMCVARWGRRVDVSGVERRVLSIWVWKLGLLVVAGEVLRYSQRRAVRVMRPRRRRARRRVVFRRCAERVVAGDLVETV